MGSSSGGEYSEMEIQDDGNWRKVRFKRKRSKNPNSPTLINPKKITYPSASTSAIAYRLDYRTHEGNSTDDTCVRTNLPNINIQKVNKNMDVSLDELRRKYSRKTNPINQTTNYPQKTANTNFSFKMKGIQHSDYQNLYYIMVNNEKIKDRIEMSNLWNTKNSKNTDVILKTKLGYLLKSNNSKEKLQKTLEELKEQDKILSFKETKANNNQVPRTEPKQTYSVVIASMEKNISNEEIEVFLKSNNFQFRYCKRIISRNFNTPTGYIRIITEHTKTFEELLSNGLFFKNRHYAVYPSNPPDPTPIPCNICLRFDHTTNQCNNTPKCTKCQGIHKTTTCKSKEPPKCLACGDDSHQAWSLKCPRHPKKPIDGIPNAIIKPLNRKSRNIEDPKKKLTRIHSSITIHDVIINTYIRKINKPKNIDREELIQKLKKRFMNEYNIDTTAIFSGNRIYILMFDMEDPEGDSPTEPIATQNNRQIQV